MTEQRFERLGYSVHESAKLASVGRSTIYEELASGRLRGRKLGRRTIITGVDLREWLAALPAVKPSKVPTL
jgi:excisionase family DNA binding protein